MEQIHWIYVKVIYMNIIVGKNSRLSSALKTQPEINKNLILLETKWALEDIKKIDPKFIRKIFCVGAITDPNKDNYEIEKINFFLPIELRKKFPLSQLITFGTILEETKMENPYVNSKRKLRKHLTYYEGNSIHFRLNTLYGYGKPKSHMFLGQLYEAFRSKTKFIMTSGKQYREYHHYDDVVKIILNVIKSRVTPTEFNISSGNPIQLLDLAHYIRKYLNINIDIFCEAEIFPNEIYQNLSTAKKTSNNFRDSKSGVANYMKDLIDGKI